MRFTIFFTCLALLIPLGASALPTGLPLNKPIRIIFASSGETDGNIGGLAGADIFVQAASANPGSVLEGQKVTALLSVEGNNAQSLFSDNGEPIYNTRGELVANSLAEMFAADSTSLVNGIQYDETGSDNGGIVWTGTEANGSLAAAHCDSFSVNSGESGRLGRADQTDGGWTEWGFLNCVNTAPVYGLTEVLIVPPPNQLFEDGFEGN
jgi:hypothetical protein